MRLRLPAEMVLLLVVLIWSGNFTMSKIALREFSPLSFFLVRFTLGALITLAYSVSQHGLPRFARRDLPLLLAGAVVGVSLNQLAFLYGLSMTSATNTALLVGTTPIWAAVIATIVGQERVAARHWLLIGLGMLGVVLIVIGGQRGLGGGFILGDGLALCVAVTWGAYTVIVRPLMRRYSAVQVSSFMMAVGTAALLPVALPAAAVQDWSAISGQGWLGLLYASLLSVTLTNVLYFRAIHRLGASRAALFGYLEPFLGVLIAIIVLRETATPIQLLGGLAVVAAVLADRKSPGVTNGLGMTGAVSPPGLTDEAGRR